MQLKRVMLSLIVAVLLVAGLGAVVSAAAKQPVIGLAASTMTTSSTTRFAAAFDKEAKKYGWKTVIADGQGSYARLTDQVQNFVQMKVDAIVMMMSDLPSIKDAIKAANKANIPIIGADSGYIDGIVCDVTSNNYVMGSQISSYLADRLGHKGNIVAFKFEMHYGTRQRGKALDMVLSENPGIKVVATHNLPPTGFVEDARATMETLLAKYPDIDAVWVPWDEPGYGVAMALEAKGKSRKDVFVTGVDGNLKTFDMIRGNSVFTATVAQSFENMARKVASLVKAIGVENKLPESVIGKTQIIYVDAPLITPENVPEKGQFPD